jgi:hypothetical protein
VRRVSPRALAAVAGAIGIAMATLVACDELVGLEDPIVGSLDDEAGADASPPTDTLPTDAGPEAGRDAPREADTDAAGCALGQTLCGGGCTSLETDPTHCGACGRHCNTLQCQGGVCYAFTFSPTSSPVRGIAASAANTLTLFAMTDEQIVELTIDWEGGVPEASVVLDLGDAGPEAGTIRSLVGSYPSISFALGPGDTIQQTNGPGAQLVTIASDAGDPVSMTANGFSVYWASSEPSAAAVMHLLPPSAPAPFAPLQPGDDACSLAASDDGVFWTSARGTFWAPPAGGTPVAITTTADRAVVPLGSATVVVAESDGLFAYGLGDPVVPDPQIVLVGPVTAATLDAHYFYVASSGGIYGIEYGPNVLGGFGAPTLVATAEVPHDCHVPVLALAGPYLFWVDALTGGIGFVTALGW